MEMVSDFMLLSFLIFSMMGLLSTLLVLWLLRENRVTFRTNSPDIRRFFAKWCVNSDGAYTISNFTLTMLILYCYTEENNPSSDPFFIKITYLKPNERSMEERREVTVSSGTTRKPLFILDINGVLAYRVFVHDLDRPEHQRAKDELSSATELGQFVAWKRPHVDEFLDYLFDNFTVAVWSSMAMKNLGPMVDYIFGSKRENLLFLYDQTKCVSTPHPDASVASKKPLFLKNLSVVWDEFPQFNASNTTLFDDTPDKAVNNPAETFVLAKKWEPFSDDKFLLDIIGELQLNV